MKFSLVKHDEAKPVGINPDDGDADGGECEICFGSGMEVIPGKGAKPCSCRSVFLHTNPFEKVRVPARYNNCHLNSFKADPKHRSQQLALLDVMRFIKEFPAVDQGLLFIGPCGVGKTHLAVSILKGLTERGFGCLFYEFSSLLKEIQDSYNPNTKSSELSILSPVLTAQVLVLDELGASKPTDWVRDTMAHIINTRYNDRKHTIFTTNYFDTRKGSEETLEDRIGVRLRSRLYEMCRTIELSGNDYRVRLNSPDRPK